MLANEITARLRHERVEFQILPHEECCSARGEAVVLGVAPEQVAKTVVLDTPSGHVRAVLASIDRLDLGRVRSVLGGGRQTHIATEHELAVDYPEFELGAVPPFGGRRDDPVLIDVGLLGQERVFISAGTHSESVSIAPADLVWLTGARVAPIACLRE